MATKQYINTLIHDIASPLTTAGLNLYQLNSQLTELNPKTKRSLRDLDVSLKKIVYLIKSYS
jgi:hypothetical protein